MESLVLEGLRTAIGDRYRIERELGVGGMAVVYLATDLRHERPVALKVMRPELANAIGSERFLREIKTTAHLSHPNILPLLDSGDANGTLYYVMPYVEGESLRERLHRERQMPIDDALRIAREVADALAYAHGQGVIHRDIKPANILLEAGHALVTDFGLARAVTRAADESITSSGLIVGTPGYMSPEQSAGAAEVDARTDVYSLACVLYEMLAGEAPYTGTSAQAIMAKQLSQPVPSVRVIRETVPLGVDQALQHALAKVPADRFPTVREFAEALTRVGAPQRKRRLTALIVLALLVGAAAAVALLRPPRPGSESRVSVSPPAPGEPVVQLAVLPVASRGSRADSSSAEVVQQLFVTELTRYRGLAVVDPLGLSGRLNTSVSRESALPVTAFRRAGLSYVVHVEPTRTPTGVEFAYVLTETESGSVVETGSFTLAQQRQLPSQVRQAAARLAVALETATGGLAKGLDVEPFLVHASNPAAVRAFLQGIEYTYKFLPGGGEHFRRAVELDPSFIGPRVFLVSGLATAGDTAAARVQVTVLESLKPKATPFEQALIGWSDAVVRGDREAKIRHLQVALGYAPRNNFALYDMAEDLWFVGRSQEAAEPVREAMESGWRFAPLYTLWGEVAAELDQLAGLRDTLEVALAFAPADPYLPGVLEALSLFEGDTLAAQQYDASFRAAIGAARVAEGYTELARTYRSLAQRAREERRPGTAVALLEPLVEGGVQSPVLRLDLARALAENGRRRAAESYYAAVAEIGISSPDALPVAGDVAELLGHTEDARRYFSKYLEVAPTGADAARVRERLRSLRRPSGSPPRRSPYREEDVWRKQATSHADRSPWASWRCTTRASF